MNASLAGDYKLPPAIHMETQGARICLVRQDAKDNRNIDNRDRPGYAHIM